MRRIAQLLSVALPALLLTACDDSSSSSPVPDFVPAFDAAGECPTRLTELPARTNNPEAALGATNANAAVGDGGLTATVSRCGEITALKWPGPSYYDHLQYVTSNAEDARLQPYHGALSSMGAFGGLAWEDADGDSGFSWLRSEDWQHRQSYTLSTSDVVRTESLNPALGITVVACTFVLPEKDVLAREYRVERDAGSPVRQASLVFYANLAPTLKRIPEFPVGDTGLDFRNDYALLYDDEREAFLHYVPGGVEKFESLLAVAQPYDPGFPLLNPILQNPPADPAALRESVREALEALPDRADGGIYFALGAFGGDHGFQAGFDTSGLCAHQSAIADRAVGAQEFPEEFQDFVLSIFSCDSVAPDGPLETCRAYNGWTYNAQSAFLDAQDGELSGSPIAACHANAALRRELDFRGNRAEATFYVAAGDSRDAAFALLEDARAGAPDQQRRDVERSGEQFLADARLPDTDDPQILNFSRRTLLSLRTATDDATGARVASVATQPPYGLDWPRDGVFLNYALDIAGYHDMVTRQNIEYARIQRDDFEPWSLAFADLDCPDDPAERSYPNCVPPGTWEMNYYAVPGGSVAGGPFSFEIDNTGLTVWTLWDHARFLKGAERSDYLAEVCPAIERAVETLAGCRGDDAVAEGVGPADPDPRLQCPANEDDNIEITQGLQGAQTVFLALRSGIEAAPSCGFDAAQVDGWETRRDELAAGILDNFKRDVPYHHFEGGRSAWMIWPVEFLPYNDPLMSSHALFILENRVLPVLDKSASRLGYQAQNMLARAQLFRALGNEAELAAIRERIRFFVAEGTTPGTLHMAEFAGRVNQDVNGDGEAPDYLPQNDVPHVWQQTFLYLAAMLAFGPGEQPEARGDP
ncbi:MAG: hypothetical protein U5K56_12610 [Halioglobus sp.]|nr:hypothetical protein [Halioglobus sp.]